MSLSQRDGALVRRVLLLCAAVILGAGLLSACGSDEKTGSDSGNESSAASAGGFTYTDDQGKTVTLPEKPKRIVVQSAIGAGLYDLGVRPIGVFGPQKLADGSKDPQAGNLDLAALTSIGQAYGEFSVEKFLALKPDLVITTVYSKLLWYIPEEAQPKIEAAGVPIIGVRLESVDIPTGIEKLMKLATALGADTGNSKITDAKAEFDDAAAKFTAAVKGKTDLKVVAVSGFGENFYVGDDTYLGGLKYFAELGLPLPSAKGNGGAYEQLSWEKVATYPADVFLMDSRDPATAKIFDDKPTWQALPAVKAGQVYPWNPEIPYSYSLYAGELERFAGIFEKVKTDLTS